MSTVLIKNNSEVIDTNEYLEKPIDIGINDDCKFCILSLLSYWYLTKWVILIKANKRKDSVKTTISYIPKLDNYNYESPKKFDELNRSLSDISDFDLERKEDISFYNSSEEDNVIEVEDIIRKSKKRLSDIKFKDDDFENEIENEFKELLKQLNVKKNWL